RRPVSEPTEAMADTHRTDRDEPLEAGVDHSFAAAGDSLDDRDDLDADEESDLSDLRPPPEPIRRRAAREFRSQADRTLQRGFSRIAERLDEVADRVNHLSTDRLAGIPGAAAADSTAAWMEETADYLRSSDLAAVQADLEEQVRRRPLQSLLFA